MKSEIASYDDVSWNDSYLFKKGGKFSEEDGWGKFIFTGGGWTVDCNKANGGIGTRHEDVDEFKGPERLVVDPFGFDGRPEEDSSTISH